MHSLVPFSLLFALFEIYPADALKLPFQGRSVYGPSRRLQKRAASNSTRGVPITNTHNAEYISNITLGGSPFAVMLDTGSSDLWVAGSVSQTSDTGKSATLSYAVGKAAGNINKATLTFDNFTVDNQAYLLVKDTSSFSTDINAQGYNGLVGLGPNTGSIVRDKVGDASGDSMMNRIFQQYGSSQNYITLLLDRLGDPGQSFSGQFTVSEIVPGYENVTSMPKLDVEKVPGLTDSDQHWQALTDVNGIIGPDGQPISVKSIVPKAPSGQLVAVLDSGFTLPQVPRSVSDAIYGRVQGAQWNAESQLWEVPCAQLLTLSFKFGGVTYPVHPLDVSSSDFNQTDSNGHPICVGAFQPITSAFSLLGEYDMILGMGFLRNIYTLLDYGTFAENTNNDQNKPFIQMLPITDPAAARKDFIQVRLNGQDTTGQPQYALLPSSQEQHSPESAAEKKQHQEEIVLSRWPYILLGCLVFVAIVVGLCIWRCCCRRKPKVNNNKGGLIPATGDSSYQPLQDPSSSQVHLQPMGSYGGPPAYHV